LRRRRARAATPDVARRRRLTSPPRAAKLPRMELEDLNQDERTALVGLMKQTVMSDGSVSEEELEYVEDLVDAFGEDGYQRTLDAFEKRFADGDAFKKFLKGVGTGRQDARELIFGTVLEAAGAEAIEGAEAELLDWLGKTWDIKIEIEDDPETV
jgi:hypothetical protein